MRGRRNTERGRELENEVVTACESKGLQAHRVFASGAYKNQLGEDFAGDVVVEGLRVECKRRKNGFGVIYRAFEQDDASVVVVRADRAPRLYVIKEDLFIDLITRGKDNAT